MRIETALVGSRVSELDLQEPFFESLFSYLFGEVIPGAEKIAAVAIGIPLVAYDGKATMERGLKRLPDADLQSLRKASLLDVLLPLVDGLGNDNPFDDLWMLHLSAQHTGNAGGA